MTLIDVSIFMLLIILGKPHSGKSQMAKAIQCIHNWVHVEPEMVLVAPEMLASAHEWCFKKTCELLKDNYHVVVSDNVDIKPYEDYCHLNDINLQIIKL